MSVVFAYPSLNSSLAERGTDPIKLTTYDCVQNQAAAGKYGPCVSLFYILTDHCRLMGLMTPWQQHNYFNQPPAVNDCAWSSIVHIFVGTLLGTGQKQVTLEANSQTVETHFGTCGIQM